MASTSTEIPLAPAPWVNLQASGFVFINYNSSTTPPSAAAYDALEGNSDFASPSASGEFAGGLCSIFLLRYTETPVGPYDELILSPGAYHVPVLPDSPTHLRITRIYVSSAATELNGRKNWGIPKQMAGFKFVPADQGSKLPYKRVEVFNPGEEDKPFFAVDLQSAAWGMTLPGTVSTTMSPLDLTLVQPPLPQDGAERVGTDKWLRVKPLLQGKAGLAWGSGGLEGGEWGDDVGFPKVKLWSLGLWWKKVGVTFKVPDVLGEEEEEDVKKTK